MRQAYAHDAVVVLDANGDLHAPGAAITVALCGHWEHEPPCPLAPHHTDAQRVGEAGDAGRTGNDVRLRVLFAAEPADEPEVRQRIRHALAEAHLDGPDGVTTRWRLRAEQASPVRADESDHATRLIRT